MLSFLGTEGLLNGIQTGQDFSEIPGIGPEKAGSVKNWYSNETNRRIFAGLLEEIELEKLEPELQKQGSCRGKTFVITGDVHIFRNRDHFKAYVEGQGGKVTGSVSGKTDYLVNNDPDSSSSKNKKAAALGIPVLSEQAFIDQFGFSEM